MITPTIADQLTVRMFDDAHRRSLAGQWGWRRRTPRTADDRIVTEAGSHRHRRQGWRRSSPVAAR
jgi:hypothetical protein